METVTVKLPKQRELDNFLSLFIKKVISDSVWDGI